MRVLPKLWRLAALLIVAPGLSAAGCAPAAERPTEPGSRRAPAPRASAPEGRETGCVPDRPDAGDAPAIDPKIGAADGGPLGPSTSRGAPHPAITAALEAITKPLLVRDFDALAKPRHHKTAPTQLAAAAGYVKSELGGLGFEVTTQRVTFRGGAADNVIGERAGEDPSRVVIVCAHYDAVRGTPGADDNASGVVGALGVARAAATARTTASVRVLAFAFEEQGLVGSAAYARSLSAADRARIIGVLNLDMIAYRDARPGAQRNLLDLGTIAEPGSAGAGDFIAVLGLTESPELFDALAAARIYEPGLRVETMAVPRPLLGSASDLLRSDHASFWEVKVPAISIVDTAEMRNPHYHRPTDTIASLDLDFALGVTRWVGAATLALAGVKAGPAAGITPPRRDSSDAGPPGSR
jgi:hypothetical protein